MHLPHPHLQLRDVVLTGHGRHVPQLVRARRLRQQRAGLLPGERGPVAQFMYQDQAGRRLTLYVKTDGDNRDTAFRYAQEGKVGVFYWLDGQLGYALSGEMPRAELLAVAEAAYRQLNP